MPRFAEGETPRRGRAALLAVAVLAGTVGVALLLGRALLRTDAARVVPTLRQVGRTPSMPPLPSITPSPPVAPLPVPPVPKGLIGAACDVSKVAGNFDEDDVPDVAVVFYPKPKAGCFAADSNRGRSYKLAGSWPPAAGIWDLPQCRRACRAFAAPDVDGDGTQELAVIVDEGASTSFFHVYQFPAAEPPKVPVEVASPGPEGFPPGPALFGWGGSVTHQDNMRCETVADGTRVLVMTSASLSEDETWRVRETVLSPVHEPEPWDLVFRIVSTRRYRLEADDPRARSLFPGRSLCGSPVSE